MPLDFIALFIISSYVAVITVLYKNIKTETKTIQTVQKVKSDIDNTEAEKKAAEAAALLAKNEALAKSNSELATIVDTFNSAYGTKIGAVVIDLSNGATATANADQQFVSASIYKLFVAYGIYQKIDSNLISLNKTIISNGNYRTVNECLDLMITISDNDCGYSLGKLYNWSDLDAMLLLNEYYNTQINNYDIYGNLTVDKQTTANDVALLLKRLYKGELLSETSTNDFLTYLKADKINDRLPSGLPKDTVIAHKIGTLYGYVHDAGIIYGTKKDTIVVLLTGEWDVPITEATPIFTALAGNVWNYMNE